MYSPPILCRPVKLKLLCGTLLAWAVAMLALFALKHNDGKLTDLNVDAQSIVSTHSREMMCNKRLAALNSTTATWDRWKRDGGTISVWVWPRFYIASPLQQRAIDVLFRCVGSKGDKNDYTLKTVEYYEIYTNKIVAEWSHDAGFKLLK